MLHQLIKIEHKIGDKIFAMNVPEGAQWGELHDALFAMKEFILKKMIELNESQKPKEEKKDEQASS